MAERLSEARIREESMDAPMAAGLLMALKAECEAQHARAEKAEADIVALRGELDEARQQRAEYQASLAAFVAVSESDHRERMELDQEIATLTAECDASESALQALQGACERLKAKFTDYRDAPMSRGNKVEIATIRKTLNVVVMEFERLLTAPPVPSEHQAGCLGAVPGVHCVCGLNQ